MIKTVEKLTINGLENAYRIASDKIANEKAIQLAITNELEKRYSEQFKNVFSSMHKQYGETTETIDGVKVKCSIPIKVTWNEEKLRELLNKRPELVDKVVQVSFSVKESTFKALTEGVLIQSLTDCRTTKIDKPKFSFEKEKELDK